MLKSTFFTFVFALAALVYAHEGEHGPSTVQAPKGGLIRSLETVHLELINKGNTLQIFIYDTDLKPAEASKYPVSATVTLPRKKAEPVTLQPKGDHWEFQFDAKGAHRFTLDFNIKQSGHDDKVKFTVEPKKK